MARDTRSTDQLKGAVSASGRLAQQIGRDTTASPQDRNLRDELHKSIDRDLTELQARGDV